MASKAPTGPAAAKPKSAIPAGIERTRKEKLAPKEFAPVNEETAQKFLDFLANPNVDAPPDGWKSAPPLRVSSDVSLLHPFHTKNFRAAVLATAPEWDYLLIAVRGKRAQQDPALFEVADEIIHAIGHSLQRVGPQFPCSIHPHFNSVLSRLSDIVAFSGRQPIEAAWALMNSRKVRVMVVPANDATTESNFDKLAHRDPVSEVTREKADAQLQAWARYIESQTPPSGCRLEGIVNTMKLACENPAASNVAEAPAPAPAPPAAPPSDDEDDEEAKEASPVPDAKPEAAGKKKAAGKRAPRPSGKCKFIADMAAEAKGEEDEEEDSEEEESEGDSEEESDSDEESGDEKSEEELSDSDEDSDDDSDEDSDEDDDVEVGSATPSSDEGDRKRGKKRAGESSPPVARKKRVIEDDDEDAPKPKKQAMKQPTLDFKPAQQAPARAPDPAPAAALAAALAAAPAALAAAPAAAPAPPPSRGAVKTRATIAQCAKTTLLALRECAAIPISKTQAIETDVDNLLSSFECYATPQWRVEDSYGQVQSLLSLISQLTSLLNSTITPEMRNKDAQVARRLSVTTASTLATMEPRARTLFDVVQVALRAASEFRDSFAGIADEFEKSAAMITED